MPRLCGPLVALLVSGPADHDLLSEFHRGPMAGVREIEEAKARLETIGRFDMPGFRPRAEWVAKIQRYGILPAGLAAETPIDVYSTEHAYWRSLWYRPDGATAP